MTNVLTSSNVHNQQGEMSIERMYQKKSQLEHILLRPDTYIGSTEPITQQMWVFDKPTDGVGQGSMQLRNITFTPGLFKIFDEILVNAADNKQRDASMSKIKVTIDQPGNTISIWNDGKGIPVQMHKDEKMYVPTMIFGHLLTSSNFDDSQKKVTGGRNGFGAKLCNVFSTKFTVETSCKASKRRFKQTWTDNMSKAKEPDIKDSEQDFTCVTFSPDLPKFKMDQLDDDTVALFTKRAYDMCATATGVSVYLNGKKLPVNNFKDYVNLFLQSPEEAGEKPVIIHEKINPRWEVALTTSEKGFQQVSFVNSIATTKGGTHVNCITDQICEKLIQAVNKKNKDKVAVKNHQIKNHMWVFVNSLIENPTFDSQTKENMTLSAKKFGSDYKLSDKFIKQAATSAIVDNVLSWVHFKAQKDLGKTGGTDKKQAKIKGVPKLDDANDAGGKNSFDCTLILTEGDSAKSLAVSGLGVVGRDKYGVFPLRGKLLNVRESSTKQILDNKEINAIMKIVGLQPKKNYADVNDLKNLRYGKIMIMTDQDQDGSHIKGLLINMVHHFWPSLIKRNFLEQFITPIVKVTKGNNSLSFYSLPEFDEWRANTPDHRSYKVKYYKGLGTSTMKEAKEYFSDMERHRIGFKYSGKACDDSVELGFSKTKISERKDWLLNFMNDRKQRRDNGQPDVYLYRKDTKQVSYSDFIHKELVLFSNTDLERSIPNMMDGLKPGQRKVLFTCLKRNDKREVKVAQLAGSVAEHSAYHHGEASLMATIINLAQNFVGSNNLNLLQPIGQFGTRLQGGKDAASPRYIFTMLSPLARVLFNPNDEPLLTPQFEDNQKIEPEYYCPVLPLILINGAEGIGTGWSTKILNHDVREVVENIRRLLRGEEPLPMLPAYKNFKGVVREVEPQHYTMFGNIAVLDETTVEITELPVGVWTQTYKENVLEVLLNGNEKEPAHIAAYREYHTDTTVKFVVNLTPQKLAEAEGVGLHKFFKLSVDRAATNMVVFDSALCIRKYENTIEILKEFYEVRLKKYGERKKYLIGLLTAESDKLSAQARFILEKIEGIIVIENKLKKKMIEELVAKNYPSDPLKAWKDEQAKKLKMLKGEVQEDEEESEESTEVVGSGPDYNYLLGMPLWSLTRERKDELLKQRDNKLDELKSIQKTSVSSMWSQDLDLVLKELKILEEKENEEDMASIALSGKAAAKKGKGFGKGKPGAIMDTKPTENVPLIEPPTTTSLKAIREAKPGAGRGRPKKIKDEPDAPGSAETSPAKSDKTGSPEVDKKPVLDSEDELVETSLAARLKEQNPKLADAASGLPAAAKTIKTEDTKPAKEPVKRKIAQPPKAAAAKSAKAQPSIMSSFNKKTAASDKPSTSKSEAPVAKRAKVESYAISSDEDDEDIVKKPKKTKYNLDDTFEIKDDQVLDDSPVVPRAKPSRAGAQKKKINYLDSDDDEL